MEDCKVLISVIDDCKHPILLPRKGNVSDLIIITIAMLLMEVVGSL